MELRDQIVVPHDGARDQVREIGDEQRIIQQRIVARLAAVGIDQVADLFEGEEGNG